MNIPPGNNTPHPDKNYYFVTDAVYFHRDDALFSYGDLNNVIFTNYGTIGVDQNNVLNIFFTYSPTGQESGYASNLDPNSKVKFNVNAHYWQKYLQDFANGQNPMEWYYHSVGNQVNHEAGHLLGLPHTVRWNYGQPCPTNCQGLIGGFPSNSACDDGCPDTPTAWDIAQLSGCTVHPSSNWGQGSLQYKCNNLMDYSGDRALTPCQLDIIHSSIEGGMKTYTACAAVATDQTYCDLTYPRVTYFGKNIIIGGCTGITANITNKEKLAAWFSGSVELNDFEVNADSEFEIIYHSECGF